jgi:hypothetical protein
MRKLALTGSPLASWIQNIDRFGDTVDDGSDDDAHGPVGGRCAEVRCVLRSPQRQQIQASALALSCACSLSLMVVFPLAIVETCLST